ncbi:Cutinase [Mycena venus]|uniref:cutinase n=1 Tax=Mycena venus TaxID=2733690 RepID=A0A8H7CQX4_9AGAR|nr:Cutinase [Mycena venus]
MKTMIFRIALAFLRLTSAAAYPRNAGLEVSVGGRGEWNLGEITNPVSEHQTEPEQFEVAKRRLPGAVSVSAELFGIATEDPNSGGGYTLPQCTDVVQVIFARGTVEAPPIGDRVGPQLNDSLSTLLALVGKTLTFIGVENYPADLIEFFEGGSLSGSKTMAQQLTDAARLCPNASLVSVGYSQGAQLVHNSARLLSPEVLLRIKAIVTFGDPDKGESVHGVPASDIDIICHSGDVVCDGSDILDLLIILFLEEHLFGPSETMPRTPMKLRGLLLRGFEEMDSAIFWQCLVG